MNTPDAAGKAADKAVPERVDRISLLARRRIVLAPVMGLLTILVMVVIVGYNVMFAAFLGAVVAVGVVLVMPAAKPAPPKEEGSAPGG